MRLRRLYAYLNLSEAGHLTRPTAEAQQFQPDVIIIDTVTADFAIKSENDNSEVTNDVMKPLEDRTPQNTTPTSFESFVVEEFVPLNRGKTTSASS